jgi:hypothetical protein
VECCCIEDGVWLHAFYGAYGKKEMTKVWKTERTLEEIKSLFFKTLYLWTASYVSPMMISYCDFLVLFYLSS